MGFGAQKVRLKRSSVRKCLEPPGWPRSYPLLPPSQVSPKCIATAKLLHEKTAIATASHAESVGYEKENRKSSGP